MPIKTPKIVVICESGTFMAFAFSRSMVTNSWGSLAENVVMAARNVLARAPGSDVLVSYAIQINSVFTPVSCSMNWKPP